MSTKKLKELNAIVVSDDFKNNYFNGFFKTDVVNPLMEYQHKPLYIFSCIVLILCIIIVSIYSFISYEFDPINECRMAILLNTIVYLTLNMSLTNYVMDLESNHEILSNQGVSENLRLFIASSMFCNLLFSLFIILTIFIGQITYYLFLGIAIVNFYIIFFVGSMVLGFTISSPGHIKLGFIGLNISLIYNIWILVKK